MQSVQLSSYDACWVCSNYGRKGHLVQKCRSPTSTPALVVNQGTAETTRNRACYECGETEHFKRSCPKLRDRGGNSKGRAFVIGIRDVIQDSNVVIGTFLINNLYENILFD